MFPLLALVVIAYLALHLVGLSPSTAILNVRLASGVSMPVLLGDVLMLTSQVVLTIETWRGVNARNETLVNHALSAMLAVTCWVLFSCVSWCGTVPFLVIAATVVVDTVVGLVISISVAKRNVWVHTN
jgi:hypothetical protein